MGEKFIFFLRRPTIQFSQLVVFCWLANPLKKFKILIQILIKNAINIPLYFPGHLEALEHKWANNDMMIIKH